jgi:hypothetical protein
MNNRQISKNLLTGIFIVGVVAISIMNVSAQPQGGTHSLVNASMQDVKEAALKYTQTRFQVLSEQVTVPLARTVIKEDLPLSGLPEDDFGGEDPPLALVVLKGEFDVRNLGRGAASDTPFNVKFIAYVFDLKAGVPTLILASADGSMFRELLNDPSLPLPEVNQSGRPKEGVEPPVPVAPAHKIPYGAMEPPVATPSDAPPTEP